MKHIKKIHHDLSDNPIDEQRLHTERIKKIPTSKWVGKAEVHLTINLIPGTVSYN